MALSNSEGYEGLVWAFGKRRMGMGLIAKSSVTAKIIGEWGRKEDELVCDLSGIHTKENRGKVRM